MDSAAETTTKAVVPAATIAANETNAPMRAARMPATSALPGKCRAQYIARQSAQQQTLHGAAKLRDNPGENMQEWWSVAVLTVQDELMQTPDPAQAARVAVRLTIAVVLGGLVGYERETRGTSAGLRTHMLVALGSALFVLVPVEAGVLMADMSRVLQGVIAGIGFLGAGAIIKLSQERKIRGLTTAASIWLTAAIGVSAGMGMGMMALAAAVLALFILAHLHGKCCYRKKTSVPEQPAFQQAAAED